MHIKHCIVCIADDEALLAAMQFMPSEADLTWICNILRHGSAEGEQLYAYSGHKFIA